MISRRQFMQKTGVLTTGILLLKKQAWAADPKKKYLVGLQLYSVRDDMKKDPLATLKELAAMGYKNVEHAGYKDRKFYGWTAAAFKKILSDLGMRMPSGHTSLSKEHWSETTKDFTDSWKQTVEDAAVVGQQLVISPWMDAAFYKTADELKRFMEVFNKCGELCKKSGMRFGYHNHDFEFSVKLGEKTVYDIILEQTDPSLVVQQLDTGNLYHTGARAQALVEQYPGRFYSMHVKDEIRAEKGEMGSQFESAVLGTGLVGVKELLEKAVKTGGTRHLIVEQESYQGKTPLSCMKENIVMMKNWGY
jgi:sugar phosphate isomerase/epimerase